MKRLVHLGLGNFHRAHQAWYTHIANGPGADWKITGVAMRAPDLYEAMTASGCRYDLGVQSVDGLKVERIHVHDALLLASRQPERVLAALTDPGVAAVTLTVTEKGYCLDTHGRLDRASPDISRDLRSGAPQSAVGLLAHALVQRHAASGRPLTILSCDNLSGNGRLLRGAVHDFMMASGMPGAALHAANFPDTMVDRITPATTPETESRMAKAAGRRVDSPVMTEAFTEWVIEDAAAGPLPDWEAAGARIVPDVAPFERRKLLLLNAAHSALAYGGQLRGHGFVHEAVADPRLLVAVQALWAEAAPLLPEFGPAERASYLGALIARFSAAGMAHRLSQIATDGSVKLPQRVLPILRHHRFDSPAASRVLAEWWVLTEERARRGKPLDDPAEETLLEVARSGGSCEDRFLRAISHLGVSASELPSGWAQPSLEAAGS